MTTQLDHLEELLAKATSLPWVCIGSHPSEGFDYFAINAQPNPAMRGFTKDIAAATGPQHDPERQANAALIVEAINALPSLIAEIRAKEERIRELEGLFDNIAADHPVIFPPDGPPRAPTDLECLEYCRRQARRALAKETDNG